MLKCLVNICRVQVAISRIKKDFQMILNHLVWSPRM